MNNKYSLINTKNYNYKSWVEKYKDYKVDLKKIYINNEWKEFFDYLFKTEQFKKLESQLSYFLKKTEGQIKIYPLPDLVFFSLNTTPLSEIKVVILGQDPYHQNEIHNNNIIPQAMGMSFSVPVGFSTPSSLKNIYKNLYKYKHTNKIPTHGNLESWAYQGCLMLNTTLTVQHGCPNSHSKYWEFITDSLIKYISNKTNNVIFVLWGNPALKKKSMIDESKHKVIVSSHPSGLSCHKTLGIHKAFNDKDHFGIINNYLKNKNKKEIIWKIV